MLREVEETVSRTGNVRLQWMKHCANAARLLKPQDVATCVPLQWMKHCANVAVDKILCECCELSRYPTGRRPTALEIPLLQWMKICANAARQEDDRLCHPCEVAVDKILCECCEVPRNWRFGRIARLQWMKHCANAASFDTTPFLSLKFGCCSG